MGAASEARAAEATGAKVGGPGGGMAPALVALPWSGGHLVMGRPR
jgi:hypothetical protein